MQRQWLRTNGGEAAFTPGTSYFCPLCNDIWARRVVSCPEAPHHPDAGKLLPKVETRRCESHARPGTEDGSLVLSEFEWGHLLDDYYQYPLEWLAYELFLIMRRDYN